MGTDGSIMQFGWTQRWLGDNFTMRACECMKYKMPLSYEAKVSEPVGVFPARYLDRTHLRSHILLSVGLKNVLLCSFMQLSGT